MRDNRTPSSTTESIRLNDWWYSAPRELSMRIQNDPPATFALLPEVQRLHDVDPWDHEYPIAPAIPIFRHVHEEDHYTVDWLVVRCPFCGDHHVHHDVIARGAHDWDDALSHSLSVVGKRKARCTSFRPLTNIPGRGDYYTDARYFVVGIDRIPSTAELNHYFPMTDDYRIFKDPVPVNTSGYVYLIKASGKYKIGISTNPDKRIESLQTANPSPISVVHIQYSHEYKRLEAELHEKYGEYRMQGEWFDLPADLVDLVVTDMENGESYVYR